MLYDDCLLSRSLKTDSGAVAHTYQVSSRPVPLHGAAKLRIALRNRPVEDSTKYYVARVNAKGRKYSVGGRYEDGALVASVRELGTFTVAVDTVPPQITAVGKQQWAKNRKVVFRLKDKETGIVSYRGTIDGEFALFGRPNIVQSVWECKPISCSLSGNVSWMRSAGPGEESMWWNSRPRMPAAIRRW